MSWTRRINHPSEVLKKGQQVEVKVLAIDKEKRRISLGLKQVGEDPWPMLMERYPINATVSGVVVKAIDRGVVVMVDNELEGFVPPVSADWTTSATPGSISWRGRASVQGDADRSGQPSHGSLVKAWLTEQDAEVNQQFQSK